MYIKKYVEYKSLCQIYVGWMRKRYEVFLVVQTNVNEP